MALLCGAGLEQKGCRLARSFKTCEPRIETPEALRSVRSHDRRVYSVSLIRALAWQIGKTRTDDPEEEIKQKAFMSQLNKLTPDNFEKISTKILEVGIEQAKTLRSLIDQVRFKSLSPTSPFES